jgi:type IV pilus assembly protein PilM
MLGFFTLRPPAFGFDLSDSSIKIVQLEEKGKKYALATFGEGSIEKGIIERGEVKKEDELAAAIKKALSQVKGKKIHTKYVVAALPEEQAFLQVVQLPPMKEAEVKGAIHSQAENYIPYPLDTVYLDYAIIPPFHTKVDHIDVLLASLPREVVNLYILAFQKAGLVPLALEIEAIALARALVENNVSPVPLLFVDIGATRTKISIFSGYSLRFTTSISLGSAQFTQAVVKALEKDKEKAEELKQEYGFLGLDDPVGKEVFGAMVPIATDFAEQIKKYLDYYETHSPHEHLKKGGKEIKKIILSGGGANLKGLPEFLMKELRCEVAVGNPWVNILSAESKELPALPFQESLRYGTALGLALRGVKRKALYD